jgi:hypothetical protein
LCAHRDSVNAGDEAAQEVMSGDVLTASGVEKVVDEARSNDVIPIVVTPYIGSS